MKKTSIVQIAFVLLILFAGCTERSKLTDLSTLLTESEVGAHAMPIEIAPVKAPFPTIDFQRPVFKSDTMVVGAEKNITKEVNAAITELSEKGGGVVYIPSGEWFSGRIELKSNVNLHLNKDAVLSFSGEIEDYRPAVHTRIEGIEMMSLGACIYANGQKNIAITGQGQLIGPAPGPVRDKILTHKVIDDVVDVTKPVSERVYEGINEDWIFPPMFISPINCEQVFIEGVTLDNTAFWNIVPIFCDNVIIRGVTVNSVGIPRGDGIDIESSRNVLIEYSTLNNGDDCFTMKSGRGPDGISTDRPTENVVVRYCLALEGHGGITCGSETAGWIRNLYVHDSVFKGTGVGINFKTRRPRGGGGENLYYERLRMDLRYTAIKWDMLGSSRHVGDLANRLPEREVNDLTPTYRNIFMNDILIENSTHFLKVEGIPESPLSNIYMNNIQAVSSDLMYIYDADNFMISNVTINSTDSLIEIMDGRNISFKNVHFDLGDKDVALEVLGDKSDNIIFENTSPQINSWFKDK